MADDINLEIGADLNEADAQRAGDRLGRIFGDALGRAAPAIGRQMGEEIARSFRRTKIGDAAFDPIVRSVENLTEQTRRAGRIVGDVAEGFDKLGEAGRTATRKINVDELNDDVEALNRRVSATRKTLSSIGAEPDLFAIVDRELKKVLSTTRAFNADLERISRNPDLLEGYQTSFRNAQQTIFREIAGIQSQLRNLSEVQRTEGNRANEIASRQAQERLQAQKAAASRFVVETQGANAQLLAETRLTGQRQIQQERIAARTRIELVRFTFRQIQILERGIAGVFRATGTVATNAARTVAAGTARIGNLFRRTNRDLNDGLGGALIARERTLDRSFSRQTANLNAELTRQSVLLDRFERQASTGITGAVTGRSRLGATLGLGAGIGGGFLLARQLREGFQESVNLTESLNALREIAGDAADEIERFSESSVENLFLTQSAAIEAAVGFASFGKSAGLGGDQLATFSTTLTQLATDLSSFRNTDVETAITSITAALAGESESIRRNYSVLLNEATLQQRAFTLGITDTVRQLQPQERVLAAYAEILAQTTDAQGDAARTSKDFANASKQLGAAIDTLFKALVDRLKPLATTIVNQLNPAVARLTELIEGDASPAFVIFKDALVGASIALAGLLVARVAAEAIQFLGIALRFAVTPLGLLVVGVAAAGAAIRVFSQRSERFAAIVDNVVAGLGDLAGQGVTLARRGLGALAELVRSRIVPAFVAFAQIVVGPLVRGLEIAVGFIINIAIPAFRRLASIIAANIVPTFQAAGALLTGTVIPALQQFGGIAIAVLATVGRFLQPAADGFRQLGDAIVAAFQTGDLSGLLGGLQAVAFGIGEVFANLGVLLYETLRPQVERAVRFIGEAFSNIDYRSIGLRVLEVVRLVGFVLGSIVSDPRFIQALEAIAVAAIAVGAKFIQGFAQGVVSNLPDLARLLGGQFLALVEAAIDFAFSNPAIVAQGLLAALAARAILNAFRSAGQQGGKQFVSGFIPAIRNNSRATRGFFAGLFGGPGAIEREATRAADRAAKAFRSRIDRANRDINRLGGVGIAGLESTARGAREAERNLGRVQAKFSDVGAEAILTGARTREAFRSAGAAAGGFAQILTGSIGAGIQNVRAGVSTLGTAIADQFRSLSSGGGQVGAALGNAVLAGFGSVIAGQQLGSGNTTIGLAGILASSLAAGLATGNAAVGVAVAGIGLFSAALSASKVAAEEAAEKIEAYADILERVGDVAGATSDIGDRVTEFFLEQDRELRQLVVRSGVSADQIAQFIVEGSSSAVDALSLLGDSFNIDVTPLIEAAGGVDASFKDLELALVSPTVATQRFFDRLRDSGVDVAEFTTLLGLLGQESSALRGALDDATFSDVFDPTDAELGTRSAEQFAAAQGQVGVAFDEAGQKVETFTTDVSEAEGALEGFASKALGLLDIDFASAFDFSFADTLGRYLGDFADFGVSIGGVNRKIAESVKKTDEAFSYQNALDALLGTDGLASAAEEAAEAVDLISPALQDLNNQRTTRVRAEIEAIRNRLDDANEAAQRARESLTEFITARYASTAQAGVDNLIGSIGSIGSEIEDALRQGGVRGEAALNAAVGGFENQLAAIIQAGFDDGLRTQEEFANLLAPLFAALDEEVGDSASRILSTTDFDFGITGRSAESIREALNRALANRQVEVGASAIVNAEAEVSRIEELLNAQEAKLEVDVVFSSAQVQAALSAAGATAEQLAAVNPASVNAAQQSALVQAVSGASTLPVQQLTPAPVVNVEQNNEITIPVSGSRDPRATASAVVAAQGAAIAGRRVAIPRFTPV